MALAAEEIERKVDERLKKLARSVRMPGFRPGKVPLKLIAQTYGSQVRTEVLGDLILAETAAQEHDNLALFAIEER
jgi:trigger factor